MLDVVIAIYDANVLYPAPLRDLLIRLAQAGMVQARWTDEIHDEWMRNVLKNQSHLSPVRLARTKQLMNDAVRDCLVTGYEDLIPTLTLPDPNDRHVLAAAIQSKADVIVTFNLKDFPASLLSTFGLIAEHPDGFLMGFLESRPEEVCQALLMQRQSLKNPPLTVAQLLTTLENQGLRQSVNRLRQMDAYL